MPTKTQLSFAALKRGIRPGVTLAGYHHGWLRADGTYSMQPNDLGVRKVEIVQSNAIAFEGTERSKGKPSWVYWPKSPLVVVWPDGFEIIEEHEGEQHILMSYVLVDGD